MRYAHKALLSIIISFFVSKNKNRIYLIKKQKNKKFDTKLKYTV